jgi:hypothetical protein
MNPNKKWNIKKTKLRENHKKIKNRLFQMNNAIE